MRQPTYMYSISWFCVDQSSFPSVNMINKYKLRNELELIHKEISHKHSDQQLKLRFAFCVENKLEIHAINICRNILSEIPICMPWPGLMHGSKTD